MATTFYKQLLALSIAAAIIIFVVGEMILYRYDSVFFDITSMEMYRVRQILIVAAFFSLATGIVTLLCLFCEAVFCRLNGCEWRDERALKMLARIPLYIVAVGAFAGLFQYIYSNDFADHLQADDYVVLIDYSGSMLENDPEKQRNTAALELAGLMTENNRFAVYLFDDKTLRLTPFEYMTNANRADTITALKTLTWDQGGSTDINAAVEFVMADLENEFDKDKMSKVILLSDGLDNGAENLLAESSILSKYREKDIAIDTVSLNDRTGVRFMQHLAHLTGGQSVFINDASSLANAYFILSQTTSDRNLIKARFGIDCNSSKYVLIRTSFIAALGILIALAISLTLDNRHFIPIMMRKGIIAGILAGLVLEFGFSTDLLHPMLLRCVLLLLVLSVFAWFNLKNIFPLLRKPCGKISGFGQKGCMAQVSSGVVNRSNY